MCPGWTCSQLLLSIPPKGHLRGIRWDQLHHPVGLGIAFASRSVRERSNSNTCSGRLNGRIRKLSGGQVTTLTTVGGGYLELPIAYLNVSSGYNIQDNLQSCTFLSNDDTAMYVVSYYHVHKVTGLNTNTASTQVIAGGPNPTNTNTGNAMYT